MNTPSTNTNAPPVDLNRLRDLSEGDLDFEREVLSVYVEDGEEFVRQINESLSARETELAAAAAHSLKGASGNIGADTLHGIAQELETVLIRGEAAAAIALYPALAHEFAKVRQYLSEHIAG